MPDKTVYHIMLIDDEPNILKLYSAILRNSGLNVSEFTTAKEALEFLQKSKSQIDLIIADVNMPEMSGIQFLDRLKNITAHSSIPLIFLSAITDSATQIDAFNLGAVDYLTKPVKKEIFLSKLKSLLQSYSLKKLNELVFMEGSKKDKSIDEIVSACDNDKLSGYAVIYRDDQQGTLFFSGGMLEKIELGTNRDTSAFEKLNEWPDYQFVIFRGQYDEQLVQQFWASKHYNQNQNKPSNTDQSAMESFLWNPADRIETLTKTNSEYDDLFKLFLEYTKNLSETLQQKLLSASVEFDNQMVLVVKQSNKEYLINLYKDKKNAAI